MKKKVAVIMGSKSDWPVMKLAVDLLKEFDVKSHVEIVSAHRTPEKMQSFAKSAQKKGYHIIIAGAGGAAHLPGMVASLSNLPVIGVPILLEALKGIDSFLSILQMPKGVPVATVAIGNAANAALLALRILALHDEDISNLLDKYRHSQKKKVHHDYKILKKELV